MTLITYFINNILIIYYILLLLLKINIKIHYILLKVKIKIKMSILPDSKSVFSDNTTDSIAHLPTQVRQKAIFVGDISVGKTSIISRFNENKFRENYEPSIGVDFSAKTLKFKGKFIKIQIWDSAGQEKYKSLIPSYIKGSSIIFVVYDICSKNKTFYY